MIDKATFSLLRDPSHLIFPEHALHTPDLFNAAWIAHAEVFPVGEVIDDPLCGGHAKLVHMEYASFGHQP